MRVAGRWDALRDSHTAAPMRRACSRTAACACACAGRVLGFFREEKISNGLAGGHILALNIIFQVVHH